MERLEVAVFGRFGRIARHIILMRQPNFGVRCVANPQRRVSALSCYSSCEPAPLPDMLFANCSQRSASIANSRFVWFSVGNAAQLFGKRTQVVGIAHEIACLNSAERPLKRSREGFYA